MKRQTRYSIMVLAVAMMSWTLFPVSAQAEPQKGHHGLLQSLIHKSDKSQGNLQRRLAALDLALYLNAHASETDGQKIKETILKRLAYVNSVSDLGHGRLDDSALDDLLNPGWDGHVGTDVTGLQNAIMHVGPRGLEKALEKSNAPGLQNAQAHAGVVAKVVLSKLIDGARGEALRDAIFQAGVGRGRGRGGRPAFAGPPITPPGQGGGPPPGQGGGPPPGQGGGPPPGQGGGK